MKAHRCFPNLNARVQEQPKQFTAIPAAERYFEERLAQRWWPRWQREHDRFSCDNCDMSTSVDGLCDGCLEEHERAANAELEDA